MSKAEDFIDAIKDNPKEIIAWAKSEICAYRELIKLVERRIKK